MKKLLMIILLFFAAIAKGVDWSASMKLETFKPVRDLVENIIAYNPAYKQKIIKDALQIQQYPKLNLADVDTQANTWLHYAFMKLPWSVLKEIIPAHFDLNNTNNLGQTPLYLALDNPDAVTIFENVLKNYPIEINKQTLKNATYLHQVVFRLNQNDALKIIPLLIGRKFAGNTEIDPYAINSFKQTAYQTALSQGKPQAAKLILDLSLKNVKEECDKKVSEVFNKVTGQK